MIRLQLYANEFFGMVGFLSVQVELLLPLDVMSRSIYDQVLVEYWQKASLIGKLPAWKGYNCRKRYVHKMPLSIARILHQEMQHVALTIYAQAFLATLDQYLTNETPNVYATRQ
ncbi:hypothetical protein GCM10028803_53110 [Larkinella knui]|uniref:Uncharacterized protein n=1 Tax=Larkinella knui TaxID=2025310 RepID=A0A3P1CGJ8_9BACT|nr:hypothetical protein [Larkinella knui]RRB12483.1 hypothetical protein EHT87_19990 [Larkinella knui]